MATCLSQDIGGAFPRWFPSGSEESFRSFKAYDGSRFQISKTSNGSRVEFFGPDALSEKQRGYVAECEAMTLAN